MYDISLLSMASLHFCHLHFVPSLLSSQVIINSRGTGATAITNKAFRIHNYCRVRATNKLDNDVIETSGTKIETILERERVASIFS